MSASHWVGSNCSPEAQNISKSTSGLVTGEYSRWSISRRISQVLWKARKGSDRVRSRPSATAARCSTQARDHRWPRRCAGERRRGRNRTVQRESRCGVRRASLGGADGRRPGTCSWGGALHLADPPVRLLPPTDLWAPGKVRAGPTTRQNGRPRDRRFAGSRKVRAASAAPELSPPSDASHGFRNGRLSSLRGFQRLDPGDERLEFDAGYCHLLVGGRERGRCSDVWFASLYGSPFTDPQHSGRRAAGARSREASGPRAAKKRALSARTRSSVLTERSSPVELAPSISEERAPRRYSGTSGTQRVRAGCCRKPA